MDYPIGFFHKNMHIQKSILLIRYNHIINNTNFYRNTIDYGIEEHYLLYVRGNLHEI